MRMDVCACTRRAALLALPAVLIAATSAQASDQARFIAEAFRQRDIAVAAGDQPYGAVIVRSGEIIGLGPSRVIMDRNLNAHAERVAIADAQRRIGSHDLDGSVLYSSSLPCQVCERAAAAARIARMIHGQGGIDAGAPQG